MATADAGESLGARLLGPMRAWRGERERELGGPQRQEVLAMLAMRANQAVSRSELIGGIWGDNPPPSAVNALHVHVAGLRKALEPHRAAAGPDRHRAGLFAAAASRPAGRGAVRPSSRRGPRGSQASPVCTWDGLDCAIGYAEAASIA
jgi:Transcriptional regulatory protein, C terminal